VRNGKKTLKFQQQTDRNFKKKKTVENLERTPEEEKDHLSTWSVECIGWSCRG
jgi:hypothetical protein